MNYADPSEGCALGFYQDPYQVDGYGLGGFFDVIAAPFKGVAKGARFVATKAVPFAVRRGLPIAAGAIPIVGGAVSAALSRRGSPPAPAYGVPPLTARQPTLPFAGAYPGTAPATDVKSQIVDVLNELKNAALGHAAGRIVETPAGQAAVRERVTGDISRYMMPALLGLGGLMVVSMMMRR